MQENLPAFMQENVRVFRQENVPVLRENVNKLPLALWKERLVEERIRREEVEGEKIDAAQSKRCVFLHIKSLLITVISIIFLISIFWHLICHFAPCISCDGPRGSFLFLISCRCFSSHCLFINFLRLISFLTLRFLCIRRRSCL